MLREPLLDNDEPTEDGWMWVRLLATVVSVSLGSSLQFGFATGSLNNLEQARSSLPSAVSRLSECNELSQYLRP